MSKTSRPTCPFHTAPTSRRNLLKGFGVAAAGGAMATGLSAGSALAEGENASVTEAPVAHSESLHAQPVYGIHQAGIVTPRPANGMLASFDVIARNPEHFETMLRTLTERIVLLTQGTTIPETDPKLPPADSGILGKTIAPDDLTITVSLGASLFEKKPWLKGLAPAQLNRMEQFPNDALQPELCHGDLSIQLCANTQDTTIHALRDILKNMPEFLVLKWKQEGNVPMVPPRDDGINESARNFLGFQDGTANPDASDDDVMDELIWVGEQHAEPEWAIGGSYQVVRLIRNFVERWDRTPLQEQETIFGRRKYSGAPLDGEIANDVPDYEADPDGEITPLDAHIRLANPRLRSTEENIILRRPFNYSNGVANNGQLDQGLLFIVYQADLEKGFITVQNRLNGEPLEEYIRPIGGGYFYTLPGIQDASDYLGSKLVAAIKAAV